MTLASLFVLLAIVATVALAGMLAVAALNAIGFPRLAAASPALSSLPAVSVLIPARNEAANIGATVRMLLAQSYPTFELLILDDQSTDGTGEVARQAAAGDPRLRVLGGAPLAAGWLGKNWACHQLAQAARHDLLLFTDADVRWQPGALAAVVAHRQTSSAALLTIWPTQVTVTWGERLVAPLMALAVLAYLPVWLAHHSPYVLAAAANGQCLLFTRRGYAQCGGHSAVRGEIIEDVRLAQRVKAVGLALRMADGAGLLQTRMYHNWGEVRDGYAKNILAGHWNSPALLLFSALFHLLVFVGPWLWLGAGLFASETLGWPQWPVALIVMGIGVRGLTAAMTQQRLRDALLLPISTLLMCWIATQALWWRLRHGGPIWKGRVIR